MRKLLLGTTAIAGAAFGLAGGAMAQDAPKVTVGGFVVFQVWQYDQDLSFGTGQGYSFGFDDAEVNILVAGAAANGLKYSLKIELEAAGESNTNPQRASANQRDNIAGLSTVDEIVLRFEGDWGQLWLGDEDGVSDLMPYGAEILMAGPGGFDGDIDDVFNFVGLPDGGSFIGPNLLGDTSDATKIQYYSPRTVGFQLGLSWTPDTGDNGGEGPAQTIGAGQFSPDNNTDSNNVYEIGVNFIQKFGEMDVGLSAVYIGGDAYTTTCTIATATRCEAEDISGWALGGYVGFAGFRIGAAYGDSGDSGSNKLVNNANRFSEHTFWNVGADYTMGPWRFSTGYHQTTREYITPAAAVATQDDESSIFSAAIQYTIAPGLIAFVEYNNISLDRSCDVAVLPGVSAGGGSAIGATENCANAGPFTRSNDGHVFIIGTQLNF